MTAARSGGRPNRVSPPPDPLKANAKRLSLRKMDGVLPPNSTLDTILSPPTDRDIIKEVNGRKMERCSVFEEECFDSRNV